MKEVRVCEAMKSPVGTLSDGTVLHQQDGGTKSRQVPIWEKSNLTLEEAAAYSGIGINKLREITNARLASAFIEAFCEMSEKDIQIKSWQDYK